MLRAFLRRHARLEGMNASFLNLISHLKMLCLDWARPISILESIVQESLITNMLSTLKKTENARCRDTEKKPLNHKLMTTWMTSPIQLQKINGKKWKKAKRLSPFLIIKRLQRTIWEQQLLLAKVRESSLINNTKSAEQTSRTWQKFQRRSHLSCLKHHKWIK